MTFEEIKECSRNHQTNFIIYSMNRKRLESKELDILYIWMINLKGDINFEKVSIESESFRSINEL